MSHTFTRKDFGLGPWVFLVSNGSKKNGEALYRPALLARERNIGIIPPRPTPCSILHNNSIDTRAVARLQSLDLRVQSGPILLAPLRPIKIDIIGSNIIRYCAQNLNAKAVGKIRQTLRNVKTKTLSNVKMWSQKRTKSLLKSVRQGNLRSEYDCINDFLRSGHYDVVSANSSVNQNAVSSYISRTLSNVKMSSQKRTKFFIKGGLCFNQWFLSFLRLRCCLRNCRLRQISSVSMPKINGEATQNNRALSKVKMLPPKLKKSMMKLGRRAGENYPCALFWWYSTRELFSPLIWGLLS